MVGLGLGVWMKTEEQASLMLQVYADALEKLELPVCTPHPCTTMYHVACTM